MVNGQVDSKKEGVASMITTRNRDRASQQQNSCVRRPPIRWAFTPVDLKLHSRLRAPRPITPSISVPPPDFDFSDGPARGAFIAVKTHSQQPFMHLVSPNLAFRALDQLLDLGQERIDQTPSAFA